MTVMFETAKRYDGAFASREDVLALANKHPSSLTSFSSWTNPMTIFDVKSWSRNLIKSINSKYITEFQRWGVREIRYNNIRTIRFLRELFPLARFVTLRRDIVSLCVSNILAGWSLGLLNGMGAGETQEDVESIINDCAYALCVMDRELEDARGYLGNSNFDIWYRDIATRATDIIEFLGLDVTEDVRGSMGVVLESRVAPTEKDATLGMITRELIEEIAPRAVQLAKQELSEHGPDIARLKRFKSSVGKYSLLVGDHHLHGTNLSSMFF